MLIDIILSLISFMNEILLLSILEGVYCEAGPSTNKKFQRKRSFNGGEAFTSTLIVLPERKLKMASIMVSDSRISIDDDLIPPMC